MTEKKIVVSFGGGTNSSAVLVNMVRLKIVPDAILFADTGGEKPETYAYIVLLNKWLKSNNFPLIQTVKYETKFGEVVTLEQDTLRRNTLPSIAFGWKSCSQRWKIRPVEKWIKKNYPNDKIQFWIGFDAGEQRRVKENPNKNYENYFPLIDWGWNREMCIAQIKLAGLCLPGKSSCFFCPNMRKEEILALPVDLQIRAMEMEKNATQVQEIKGLGRNKSWTSIIEADRNQTKVADDLEDWHQTPCECID